MLGLRSLHMLFVKNYAWMPKETRNNGSAMMRAYESVQGRNGMIIECSKWDRESGISVPPPSAALIPD